MITYTHRFSLFSLSLFTLISFLQLALCSAQNQTELSSAFPDLASRIPACGLSCVLRLAPNSSCLREDPAEAKTCLCNDDMRYYPLVLGCVQGYCTVEESIETARGAWEACGKAKRSRKADLLAPLSIEIPALICALLRLYSRWWSVSRFEVDDYIMIVVVVLYVVFEILGEYAAQSAFGVDIWTVRPAELTLSLKLFYIGESFYLCILTLTKISILCFYLRIFPNRIFRVVAYTVMAWVAMSGVLFVFLQVFQCIPIAVIWEGWKKGGFGWYRCLDINTLAFTTAGFSIAQDIVILVMPLPLLARLNVSRRSKFGIMVMFSLGIFVLITSCVRLWSLYTFGDSVNPTWDYTDALIWTGLEVAVSIIVTSLPAIRVLVSRRIPSVFGSLVGSHWGDGGGGHGFYNSHGSSSTSSFGDTTFVGSLYGTPPALKRLSAISHISSIKVSGLMGNLDYDEKRKSDPGMVELGDKTKGDVRTEIGVGDVRMSAPTAAALTSTSPSPLPADSGWSRGLRRGAGSIMPPVPNIGVVIRGRSVDSGVMPPPPQSRPPIIHVHTTTTRVVQVQSSR
ncbi:CFEM domain-containing protein [Podospora appendiculata]|uniref:CFEM domain-containing protein n=1 Tax=Podospora appendiculata TaxID=314037 RepID=A0AAE0X3D2_9PEZI|nr:CFEM domain-containing protein [Podospora appendiculata]KAK3683969.1 CFEM domain-containing protein [Podospora appendiculata]